MSKKTSKTPELSTLSKKVDDFLDIIKALESRIENLEKENKEQAVKIKELEKKGESSAANKEDLWSNVVSRKKSEVRLNMLNVVSDENKERSKKEKNIIVFGLRESTKGTIAEKKEDDAKEINQILEVLALQDVEVDGVFRLNARDKEKPKPLVMVLKNKETRNRFLQAAKKLKNSNDHKTVFLSPDLTESQRLKYKELVKIRDSKNEKLSGEDKEKKIWCIRDNEVVLLKKKM